MSQLFVDNIKGRTGGAIGAPSGVNATGVQTCALPICTRSAGGV